MTGKTQTETKLHNIGIRLDGKGFVYSTPERPDAKVIYVRKGDHVKWNCSHGNYSILFKEHSPFIDVGAHGRSGGETAILEVVAETGNFKYAVNVALPNGSVVDDPEIIVGGDPG